MAVCLLDKNLWFPDPHLGEEDGLVAIGGDLSVDRLILAYSNGFFPWFSFRDQEEPLWFCPLQRFVIFPSEIHVSHSMKQLLKKNPYQITINKDFEGVMRGCATAQNRNEEEGAWPRVCYTLILDLEDVRFLYGKDKAHQTLTKDTL